MKWQGQFFLVLQQVVSKHINYNKRKSINHVFKKKKSITDLIKCELCGVG